MSSIQPTELKKCYVAGKIGDLPEPEYRAQFEQGKLDVLALDMLPVCPIDLPHEHDKSWLSHMREDLSALLQCDILYALSGWQTSKGATIEVNLARTLGIAVIEQANPSDYCPQCQGPCTRNGVIYEEDLDNDL